MTIKTFHVIAVENGMIYIGLDEENKIRIYDAEGEIWKTIKETNEEGKRREKANEIRNTLLGGGVPRR